MSTTKTTTRTKTTKTTKRPTPRKRTAAELAHADNIESLTGLRERLGHARRAIALVIANQGDAGQLIPSIFADLAGADVYVDRIAAQSVAHGVTA